MAGGPMAGVVTQLSSASEADVQAMAHYLSTIKNSSPAERLKNISDIPIKPSLILGNEFLVRIKFRIW